MEECVTLPLGNRTEEYPKQTCPNTMAKILGPRSAFATGTVSQLDKIARLALLAKKFEFKPAGPASTKKTALGKLAVTSGLCRPAPAQPSRCCPAQAHSQNCFSVTPALIIPVEEVPAEIMVPASSTISEPLHFWCVRVSTLFLRSSRWMS